MSFCSIIGGGGGTADLLEGGYLTDGGRVIHQVEDLMDGGHVFLATADIMDGGHIEIVV